MKKDDKKKLESDPAAPEAKEEKPGDAVPEDKQTDPASAEEKPGDEAVDDSQVDESGEGAEADPAEEKPDEAETAGDSGKPGEDKENPAGDKPAGAPSGGNDAKLMQELLSARSQLAAYASGVSPDMIQDAVTLATAEAQAAGEVTEEAVVKAMDSVLKRHPEWKAAGADKKKTGGFKLGFDQDSASRKKTGNGDPKNAKRWNRFK